MTISDARDTLQPDPIADQLRSIGLPPDLERRFQWLTPKQRAVLALQTTGLTWREAAAKVGVQETTARRWYASDNYRLVSRGIVYGTRDTAVTLAQAILTSAAPMAAQRMADTATGEPRNVREMPTRLRAQEDVLQATGVIPQRGPQVQVGVSVAPIRYIEVRAVGAGERLAIEGETEHNVTQSSQSALSPEAPDTNGEHKVLS